MDEGARRLVQIEQWLDRHFPGWWKEAPIKLDTPENIERAKDYLTNRAPVQKR